MTSAERTLETLLIRYPLEQRFVDRLKTRFPDLRIVVAPENEAFLAALPEADAILGWGLSPDELKSADRLQWVQTVGAGVENVISPELIERDILLTNNSGVHAPNIAEHLMAMMLAFARCIPYHVHQTDAKHWGHLGGRDSVFELNGQTLLVVGIGDIGLALAVRAEAFGMRTIGVRRRHGAKLNGVDRVVTIDELPSVIGEADHVAICLPLTKATTNLFDAELLASMKPGAYLYNIGRGAIIDQTALVAALEQGHLGGAGLDVTDPEPLPDDNPLWLAPNVLITSHTSGATPNYWDRAIVILETNIERFRSGSELLNVVDTEAGY